MDWDCIHYHGSHYEGWCDMRVDVGCDECPYRYTEEDYENDLADYKYDTYRDFL